MAKNTETQPTEPTLEELKAQIESLSTEKETALAELASAKETIADLETALALSKATPTSSLQLAKAEKKPAYEAVIVKDVEFVKNGQKETADFKILAPALDIDGVTYTAAELAADKEAIAKLAANGSSFLKPYFETT